MKCSEEVPSCQNCLLKGEHCGGYPPRKIPTRRRRPAVTRSRSRDVPTDAPLPVPEDQGTDYQVLAPQDDASIARVGEGPQQNVTTNSTMSRNEAGTDSMEAQRSYLRSLFHYLDEPQEKAQGQKR